MLPPPPPPVSFYKLNILEEHQMSQEKKPGKHVMIPKDVIYVDNFPLFR